MTASIWIKQITFNDGTVLELGKNDIVLFVGPNNAGKSLALRRLYELFGKPNNPVLPIINSIETQRDGTEEDFSQWLQTNYQETRRQGDNYTVSNGPHSHRASDLKRYWKMPHTAHITDLGIYFSSWAAAGNRLEVANSANNIRLEEEAFTHPIHYLYANDTLEERLSKRFNEAFGLDLIVGRASGSQIPLHCGKRPPLADGEDRLSANYLKKIYRIPLLDGQGDGMRSFVGCLLLATIVEHSVILIDEPESFLHPPQARLLGRMLAKDKPHGRQLFLATHSGEFLRGLLSAEHADIRVLRIRRDGSINPVRELKPEKVRQLWRDPLLRHSQTLDGLFHEKVILCESDSDCRFYGAMLDALLDSTPEQSRPAIMFTHCGGKHRMPVVIESLVHLGVPLNVVLDFDILQDEQPLHKIFELLGGQWATVQKEWEYIKDTVVAMRAELTTEDVKRQLQQIVDSVTERSFPNSAVQKVRDVVRRTSAWSYIKTIGTNGLPPGQPTQALERLLSEFKAKGLFIVDVGELEGFCRTLGLHGPAWVNDVLEKNLLLDLALEDARQFVKQLIL